MKNYITQSYLFCMVKGLEELISEDIDNDYLQRKYKEVKKLYTNCVDNDGLMTKKLYWQIVKLDNDIYENYISSFDEGIDYDYLDCDYMSKSNVWYPDLSSYYKYHTVLRERPLVWTTKKKDLNGVDYNDNEVLILTDGILF